jgi:hypothetical protein
MPAIVTPSWKRQHIWIAPEASGAYGTLVAVAGTYHHWSENSNATIWTPPPYIQPAMKGDGQPQPSSTRGRFAREAGAFTTRHPVTLKTWANLMALALNGRGFTDTDPYFSPYTVAGVPNWPAVMTPGFHADLQVQNDTAGSGANTFEIATGAVMKSLTFIVPQQTPGDASGFLELEANWLSRRAYRSATSAFGVGTPVEDAGTEFQGRNVTATFEATTTATAADILSAKITIDPTCFLDPSCSTYAGKAYFGECKVSGSITMYWAQGALAANGHASEDLLAHFEAGTYDMFTLAIANDAGVAQKMAITCPFVIVGKPEKGVLNDILTVTFNFKGIYAAAEFATHFFKVQTPAASMFGAAGE